MKIKNVTDPEFRQLWTYRSMAMILQKLIKVMEQTPLPEEVIYVPSD